MKFWQQFWPQTRSQTAAEDPNDPYRYSLGIQTRGIFVFYFIFTTTIDKKQEQSLQVCKLNVKNLGFLNVAFTDQMEKREICFLPIHFSC